MTGYTPRRARAGSRVLVLLVALVGLLPTLAACVSAAREPGPPGGPCEAVGPPDTVARLAVGAGLVYLGAPAAHTLYAFSTADGALRWTFDRYVDGYVDRYNYNNPLTSHLTGVYADGVLVLSTDGQVRALRAADGQVRVLDIGPATGQHGPLEFGVGDGLLVASNDNAQVQAFALDTGVNRWQRQFDSVIQAIEVVNGLVYVLSQGGSVVALHASDGTLAWQFVSRDTSLALGMLTVQGGAVYATGGHLVALDASDGTLRWQYPMHPGPATLVVDQGQVYLSDLSKQVTALRESDGQVLWQQEVLDGRTEATLHVDVDHLMLLPPFTLTLANGRLLVGGGPGVVPYDDPDNRYLLTAFRASDGGRLWTALEPAGNYRVLADGEVGYVLTRGELQAINLSSGTQRWQQPVIGTNLLLAAGAIYVGTAGTTGLCYGDAPSGLSKLDASTGALLWQQHT